MSKRAQKDAVDKKGSKAKDKAKAGAGKSDPDNASSPDPKAKKKAPKSKEYYFVITDKRALGRDKRVVQLNHGRLKVTPVTMVINGKLGYFGGRLLDVDNGVVHFSNMGTPDDEGTLLSLRRKVGVLELTEEIILKVLDVGTKLGYLEQGD